MTRNAFDTVYKKLITSIAEAMCNNLGKAVNLKFTDNIDALYDEYQKQKTFFRLLCNKNQHNTDGPNLLDRHKVCAALCVAIIRSHLLSSSDTINDNNRDMSKYHKYNEQLAISVSLNLLAAFIDAEYAKETDPTPFISEELAFTFPKPLNSNEDYEDTIVRSIYFANTVGQLNLHLIAHIFFQVEQYHMLYRKFEELEQNNKTAST